MDAIDYEMVDFEENDDSDIRMILKLGDTTSDKLNFTVSMCIYIYIYMYTHTHKL